MTLLLFLPLLPYLLRETHTDMAKSVDKVSGCVKLMGWLHPEGGGRRRIIKSTIMCIVHLLKSDVIANGVM